MIIAITGPAGAGKSTVAKKLAKKRDKTVNIEADQVKHFIQSGFSYELDSDGNKIWSFTEWVLAGESIGLLAENFQKKGFEVIVNGYIPEVAWREILKKVKLTHRFLLLPGLATVVMRDKQRSGDEPMGSGVVKEHHEYFSNSDFYKDFKTIDSSEHSVDETVNEILEALSQKR